MPQRDLPWEGFAPGGVYPTKGLLGVGFAPGRACPVQNGLAAGMVCFGRVCPESFRVHPRRNSPEGFVPIEFTLEGFAPEGLAPEAFTWKGLALEELAQKVLP